MIRMFYTCIYFYFMPFLVIMIPLYDLLFNPQKVDDLNIKQEWNIAYL